MNYEGDEGGYEIVHTANMSLTERLMACLHHERMTDVALVGDDGITVPACRFLLGSVSPVLQPLLYDTNNDQNAVVTIRHCRHRTLQALVEYACSDELHTIIWADCGEDPERIVQDTVALAKLSHLYEIPPLQGLVKDFLTPLMMAYPPLACSVFNLADAVATPLVFRSALHILLTQPYVALPRQGQVGGTVCLSPEKLDLILRNTELEADELFLFEQLIAWKEHNAGIYGSNMVLKVCRQVVRHFDLSSIDPNAIETIVIPSGIVTAEFLVQGLLGQAKTASNNCGLSFASLRGARGRKFAHVLVQGAGDEDCNGTYLHVEKPGMLSTTSSSSSNMLYFIKKADEHKPTTKKLVLVKDALGTWRICDSTKAILYERKPTDDGQLQPNQGFPQTGWACVSGTTPAPSCSWLRPKGGSPFVPSTIASAIQAKALSVTTMTKEATTPKEPLTKKPAVVEDAVTESPILPVSAVASSVMDGILPGETTAANSCAAVDIPNPSPGQENTPHQNGGVESTLSSSTFAPQEKLQPPQEHQQQPREQQKEQEPIKNESPHNAGKSKPTSRKEMSSLLDSEGGISESLPYVTSEDETLPPIDTKASNFITPDNAQMVVEGLKQPEVEELPVSQSGENIATKKVTSSLARTMEKEQNPAPPTHQAKPPLPYTPVKDLPKDLVGTVITVTSGSYDNEDAKSHDHTLTTCAISSFEQPFGLSCMNNQGDYKFDISWTPKEQMALPVHEPKFGAAASRNPKIRPGSDQPPAALLPADQLRPFTNGSQQRKPSNSIQDIISNLEKKAN